MCEVAMGAGIVESYERSLKKECTATLPFLPFIELTVVTVPTY